MVIMPIKIIMPTAYPELIPKLRKHVNDEKAEVVGLYKKLVPEDLSRQAMIYIANSAPKMITSKDKVYVLVVNSPVLMMMITSRITERINKLFSRSRRRWYLLVYDPKTKDFIEYYLP